MQSTRMSEPSGLLAKLASKNKASKVQMHVELPEQVLTELKAVIPRMGYSSISEFIREMARRTIRGETFERHQ